MVWPNVGSSTAEEQNSDVFLYYCECLLLLLLQQQAKRLAGKDSLTASSGTANHSVVDRVYFVL